MTTITQTITALPDAPSSSDPSTFETKADAFVAALPPLVTEINTWADQADTVASEVNANAAAADVSRIAAQLAETNAETAKTNAETAQAAAELAAASAVNQANVQGTSTSSVAIPTSETGTKTFVYVESSRAISVGMFILAAVTASPGVNWVLLQVTSWTSGTKTLIGNVITYSGSGTYSAWTLSLTGPRGRAGADVVLTTPFTAKSGAVSLAYTDNGSGSNLTSATVTPDAAATLTNGWTHFLRATSGSSTITATFDDGFSSKTLVQGQKAILSSNGSTMQLDVLGAADPAFGTLGTPTVVNSGTSARSIAAAGISSTRALMFYTSAAHYPRAALVSSAGSVLSSSGDLESTAIANISAQVVALTSTTALAIWATSAAIKVVVLQDNAGTVASGSIVVIETTAATYVTACVLSSTKVLITYGDSGNNRTSAMTVTISGTTATANTRYTLLASEAGALGRVTALSSTQALLVFNNAATLSASRGLPITEASNVLTFPAASEGISVTGASGTTAISDVINVSSTKALVVAGNAPGNSGTGITYTVDIAGTGASALMSVGIQTPIVTAGSSTTCHRLLRLSASSFLHLVSIPSSGSADDLAVQLLTLDGDRIRPSASKNLVRRVGRADIAIFGTGTLLVPYVNTANSDYSTIVTLGMGNIA